MKEKGSQKAGRRNGDVEVFRCLLMFLIVAYHCFIYGPCSQSKALWTMCFTVLICWHTDGFLAISGWYGIRFKWSRFWGMVGQFGFYGALSCIYCWMTGSSFRGVTYSFMGGWFGSTYLALMALSPLINRAVEVGWERCRGFVFAGVGLIAALLLLSWITGRFGVGMAPVKSFGIYSVLLMVYLYCVARLLRKMFEGKKPRLWALFVGIGVFVLALLLYHLADVLHQHATGVGITGIGAYFAAFDAPQTVLMTFALLLLFVYYVRLPKWCGDFAVRLSPYLFGVYLCHATTSFGGRFYELENWLVNSLHLHGFFAVLLTAVFIFVVCIGVEMVRMKLKVCSEMVIAFSSHVLERSMIDFERR